MRQRVISSGTWERAGQRSSSDRKTAALKVANKPGIPTNWNQFSAVDFWVNVRAAPRGAQAVLRCGLGKAAKGKKQKVSSDGFFSTVNISSTRGAWKKIRLPIADFKPQGSADLSNIAAFQLQIPGGAQFDFMIDKIVLVKKESAPARR